MIARKSYLRVTHKSWLILLVIIGVGFGIYLLLNKPPANTLPPDIQSQVSFKQIFPETGVAGDSVHYNEQSKILIFNTDINTHSFSVTEQPAPDTASKSPAEFTTALGIKPVFQFGSKIGQVAVANIYTEQHPKINKGVGPQPVVSDPIGQSAISITNGTLLIVRPTDNQSLSQEQWEAVIKKFHLQK